MKFTDSMIRALKSKEDRYEVWEGRGFGVRVFPSGEKSWVFLYRWQGKARRMTLGKYPGMTLTDAHEAHIKARQLLLKELDPGVKAVEARKAERDASTIEGLAELYIELHAKKRKRSWAEDQRILGKDILPAWRNRKAKDITRRDVVALLDKIAKRGAGVQANRTLAVIRKMFNFAMGRSLLDASPCVAILAPAKENQRDRNLSQDEIRVFWEGLAQARMDEKIKLTLKLMLATAQRKGEIVNAAWTEFDLKSGWWTIPAERAKNGRAHRVPLAPIVLDLLKRAKELSGDSPFVFPSPRGGKAITGPAVDHALRVNRDCFKANGSPVADFTPHDLRRTAASMMTSIKIPRLVVSKILNHVETGITAVYDRHSYDDEKRQALEAWARKLENILTGKEAKVIPLMKR